jgi:predicted amidohydrolase YtcJ
MISWQKKVISTTGEFMTLALINSKIYTISSPISKAEAVIIEGDRISKVGPNEDILDTLDKMVEDSDDENIQKKIRVIDLEGTTMVPGFFDSHTHFLNMGLNFLRVDLSKVKNKSELYTAIKTYLVQKKQGVWVLGVDFDESQWEPESDQTLPTCTELDEISTVFPIVLRRICGHIAVANSAALEEIDKYIEEHGLKTWQDKFINYSTGILLEDIPLSLNKIIEPTPQEEIDGLKKAINISQRLGVTSLRDIVNIKTLELYLEFLRKNELKVRISAYVKFENLQEFLDNQAKYTQINEKLFLTVKGVKIFLDGSIGAHTAALSQPYKDDPKKYGQLMFTNSELTERLDHIFKNNLNIMAHAIGDNAVDQLINVYSSFVTKSKIKRDGSARNSIEHLEVVRPDQLTRIKGLGIIASMQPNFAGQWSIPDGLNEKRLGSDRLEMCNAYNTILSYKIPTAFGSDCMPFNPIYGIHSAVNHPVSSQRITAIEALKAYTIGSAYAAGDENVKGSIEPGKLADMVVLSDDILAPENAEKIKDIKVEMTILGGEIVYDSRENK